MADGFKRLMRKQLQENLDSFADLINKPLPKKGWIRTIREALGMSSYVLADRFGCSRVNITSMEQREKKKTISLETLEQAAQAMNCKLVYCFVPTEPISILREKQARSIAKKRIEFINHSMKLEQQGLSKKQLKYQEDDLVQELLEGSSKKLWNDQV